MSSVPCVGSFCAGKGSPYGKLACRDIGSFKTPVAKRSPRLLIHELSNSFMVYPEEALTSTVERSAPRAQHNIAKSHDLALMHARKCSGWLVVGAFQWTDSQRPRKKDHND